MVEKIDDSFWPALERLLAIDAKRKGIDPKEYIAWFRKNWKRLSRMSESNPPKKVTPTHAAKSEITDDDVPF